MSKQAPLKDRVSDYIYSKIIKKSLSINSKISQETLAKDLQVSRTPIREALIELTNEGLLVRKPNRGFWLRNIDLEELKEVYSIIGCLEGYAASIASFKLSREDFILLKKLTKKMDRSIENASYSEYYSLQLDFHNLIVKGSRNKKLFDLVLSLKNSYIRQVHLIFNIQGELFEILKQSNNEHKHIVELLENGDKKGVLSYLQNVHWKITQANLIFREY